jgi:gliding motility-associated-like protein
MKKILLIAIVIANGKILGQTITPQVINSAGSHRQVGTSNIWITDNVGEPFTETIGSGNFLITQGFIQPDIISKAGFTLMPTVQDFLCADKADGSFIYLAISTTLVPKYNVQGYYWTPATVCPGNNCDTLRNIVATNYSVMIPITYTNNVGAQKLDTLRGKFTVKNSTTPCLIQVFSGITPNSDGVNDVFTIENIEQFPNNHVMVFSRWGKQLCDIKNYNGKDKSWPNKDQASNLLPSTYFYIIELGNNTQPIKGWVELIKEE